MGKVGCYCRQRGNGSGRIVVGPAGRAGGVVGVVDFVAVVAGGIVVADIVVVAVDAAAAAADSVARFVVEVVEAACGKIAVVVFHHVAGASAIASALGA